VGKPTKSADLRHLTTAEAGRLLSTLTEGGSSKEISGVEFPSDYSFTPRTYQGLTVDTVTCEAPRLKNGFLRRLSVVDSNFKNVTLEGVRCSGAELSRCRFDEVSFGKRLRGVCNEMTVSDSEVVRCRAEAMSFSDCSLSKTRFEDVSLRDIRWQNGTWSEVRVSGRITRMQVVECRIVDCDLSAARLSEMAFVDCQIRGLRVPAREDNFVVNAASLLEIVASLQRDLGADAMAAYVEKAKVLSRIRGPVVIEGELWSMLDSDARGIVMDALFRARREVID
jgi:uncharacterized protein YjbI with pentapeptide repeats